VLPTPCLLPVRIRGKLARMEFALKGAEPRSSTTTELWYYAMKTFHELSLEERINVSHLQLERMRRPNGGYIASPYNAEDGSGDA